MSLLGCPERLPRLRIVSLLPSATEIVYALGLDDGLVAVTEECDHPPAARAKPVVSRSALALEPGMAPAQVDRLVSEQVSRGEALYTLDAEGIRALEPDLILTQDLCRVCAVPSGQVEQALQRFGSTTAEVLSLDPHSLEDVLAGVLEVGRRAGAADRAADLVETLRGRMAAVDEVARPLDPVPTLTLEWSDPPFAGGHWVPEMVERAGGRHLLVAAGEPSRRVAWDEITDSRPEVVVFMPCGYGLDAALAEGAPLAGLAERVFAVDASSHFSRPGPRLVDGLEVMAWALHPDVFPPPPPGRIARLEG
jgi:iron complex transport system substrate-binding protein